MERRRWGRRREFYFLSYYLSCIVNDNFEGAWTVTHSVKNRELTRVDYEGLASSFVIVGISFRSTPCISASTF